MSGGYTGKVLDLDLNTCKSSVNNTNMNDAEEFIGAKGLGAKILIDNLPRGTDPLSKENIIIITTGPLTGTSAQTSGRGTVVTKSPLTGLFLDSHFGGVFAAEMKKAGWDIIILHGKSNHPKYISIKDDKIEFKDATDLMGMECLKSHEKLQKIEGKMKTAVIGPAGEKMVRFASITFDGHRHAGRGGPGAVLGSKNIKGICIRGTGSLALNNKTTFDKKAKEVLNQIKENNFVPIRRKYGTPYWVHTINTEGLLPTKNYKEGYFKYGENLNAETMQSDIVDGGGACYNCIIACWNKSSIKKGPFKGVNLIGPEYETIALMGSNLGMKSIEDVAYICDRCNELGMDTISCGGVLGFAIELYEKGIIKSKNLNNNSIGWGKAKELAMLMDDVANRRYDLANIFADGVRIASEKIGKNSKDFAVHVKGMELPGYDPRGAFGMGIAYATSDRGACHQRAWTVRAELNDPELNRFSFEKKAQIVKNIQDERAAFFSLVLCDFAPISEENCVDMWNLATGFNHNVESYLKCGERIWNLIRLFNIREGLNTEEDTLPPRILYESFKRGPAKNRRLNEKQFNDSLQDYYKIRGWNTKGIPTVKKIIDLGLDDYLNIID